jgi:hypothetical protein
VGEFLRNSHFTILSTQPRSLMVQFIVVITLRVMSFLSRNKRTTFIEANCTTTEFAFTIASYYQTSIELRL